MLTRLQNEVVQQNRLRPAVQQNRLWLVPGIILTILGLGVGALRDSNAVLVVASTLIEGVIIYSQVLPLKIGFQDLRSQRQ